MNEEERALTVPYIVHEGVQVRLERTIRRLIIALVMTILLMFASNGLWLWAWMQYDYEGEETNTTITRTIDIDGKDGIAGYIGGSGRIINGANSSDYNNCTSEEEETAETEEWEQ